MFRLVGLIRSSRGRGRSGGSPLSLTTYTLATKPINRTKTTNAFTPERRETSNRIGKPLVTSPSTNSPSPPSDPLATFWSLSSPSLLDSTIRRRSNIDAASGALESQWTIDCIATIRSQSQSDTSDSSSALTGRKSNGHTEQSPAALKRPSETQLIQIVQLYERAIENSAIQLVPFDKYTQATLALIRLTVENPRRGKNATMKGGTKSANSHHLHYTHPIRSDPFYCIRLLKNYWKSLTSPLSPWVQTHSIPPTQIGWLQTSACIQAILGTVGRTFVDGQCDDRAKLIRAIISMMREQELSEDATRVNGANNVFEYAIRHDTFYRALLFATIHSNDLNFAALLLEHTSRVTYPTMTNGELEWVPITRRNQMHLIQQFMAKCCHELLRRSSSASSTTASDASNSTARSISSVTLENLYPGFIDLHLLGHELQSNVPLPFDSHLEQTATTPLLDVKHPSVTSGASSITDSTTNITTDGSPHSLSTPAIHPKAGTLELLLHAFRSMVSRGFTPDIQTYNFLIFGLTHWTDGDAVVTNSPSTDVRLLLKECLEAIDKEGLVKYNLTSITLILRYALNQSRTHSSTASSPDTDADTIALLRWSFEQLRTFLRTVQQRHWRLRKGDDENEKLYMTTMQAELVIQSFIALHQLDSHSHTPATATAALDSALLRLHDELKSLLPTPEQLIQSNQATSSTFNSTTNATATQAANPSSSSSPNSSTSSQTPITVGLWSKLFFSHLCHLDSSTSNGMALEHFLDANHDALTDDDLVTVLETIPTTRKVSVYEAIEEWMGRLANKKGQTTGNRSAPSSSSTSSSSSSLSSSATSPSPSSMSVSGIFLHWQLSKTRLSPRTRFQLGLGPPPPAFDAREGITRTVMMSGGSTSPETAASIREAAKYVIYHARRLHLEQTHVDAPLSRVSHFRAPELNLPPSVLGAPNFLTGWVVILAGWFQQLGEENAFTRIKGTLSLVGQAASGRNDWDKQFQKKEAAAATAASKAGVTPLSSKHPSSSSSTATPPASSPSPSLSSSPSSDAALHSDDSSSGSSSDAGFFRRTTSAFTRWANAQASKLLDNPIESIHIFTPVPPSTPLLETRVAFGKLPPELLGSIIYSYSTLPHLRDVRSSHWARVLNRLDTFTHLFDLRSLHPILLKSFHSAPESVFLKHLRDQPVTLLHRHCEHLAKQWDPQRTTQEMIRARRMWIQMLKMSQTTTTEAQTNSSATVATSNNANLQFLTKQELQKCLKPFVNKIATKGSDSSRRRR